MIIGTVSPWTGRFYSLLDPSYAKNHIPIIASVSEHQPTSWSSFYFDLQVFIEFHVSEIIKSLKVNFTSQFIFVFCVDFGIFVPSWFIFMFCEAHRCQYLYCIVRCYKHLFCRKSKAPFKIQSNCPTTKSKF